MRMDAWQNLAGAICAQAAEDLMTAYRKLRYYRKNPRSAVYGYYAKIKIDCELFFRSQWYATLCDVDGEYVIEHIREESRYRK